MAPAPEANGAMMAQSAAPAAAPVDAMPKMKQLQKQVRLARHSHVCRTAHVRLGL
jgi:hypothetical protein